MLQLSDLTLEDIFLKITMGENLGADASAQPEKPRINIVIDNGDAPDADDETDSDAPDAESAADEDTSAENAEKNNGGDE